MLISENWTDEKSGSSQRLFSRIKLHEEFTRDKSNFWRHLAQEYPWDRARSVLEFGCGSGGFWQVARKMVAPDAEVLLTDASMAMLQDCDRKIMDSRFSFLPGNIETLDIDHRFDLVLSHFLLYHLDDPQIALRNIKQHMSSSGVAGIATVGDDYLLAIREMLEEAVLALRLQCKISCLLHTERFSETIADRMVNEVFGDVRKVILDDYLDVTRISPFLDYCRATYEFSSDADKVYAYLTRKLGMEIAANGKISIPKRVVLYVANA